MVGEVNGAPRSTWVAPAWKSCSGAWAPVEPLLRRSAAPAADARLHVGLSVANDGDIFWH
jgi:hypothetical protein